MYKKIYEMSQERRRNKKGRQDNNRSHPIYSKKDGEFASFDDYIEYTKNNNTKKEVKNKKNYVEIDYTMDGSVKQLFLNLTKMQITFDKEHTLENFFPESMKKDKFGNYFINIGVSKTMFCGHLDTYSKKYEKVYHIIEGDIISTNGTTVLGGDDKAGITIMLKMIENNIPGLYYFFRGEEGVTSPTGTWGSKQALKEYKDIFKSYERCIAFDRRGFKSIISKQMYTQCCSDEFVNSLSLEFKKTGMDYIDDKTGMWCDSGVFMELIPECTNISVGYLSEHTFNETQDIKHLEELCNACIKINWEELPVKRDPNAIIPHVGNYRYNWGNEWDDDFGSYKKKNKYIDYNKSTKGMSVNDIFYSLVDLLETLGYECYNSDMFQEAEEMYFQNPETTDFFAIRIIDKDIYMSDDKVIVYECYGTFEDFRKFILIQSGVDVDTVKNDTDDSNIQKFNRDTIKTYQSIVDSYPVLLINIIKQTTINKQPEVSNDLWFKIDKIMYNDLQLKMDYSNPTGYNPDSFIEWVYSSNGYITNKLNIKKNTNNTNINDFLKKIKNYESYYYTDKQYLVFSNIIMKEKELIKLILKDIDIHHSPTVRESTYDKIIEAFNSNGYGNDIEDGVKKINPQQFVIWVYDYTDKIIEYYDTLK